VVNTVSEQYFVPFLPLGAACLIPPYLIKILPLIFDFCNVGRICLTRDTRKE
jgi:hypothetical protein